MLVFDCFKMSPLGTVSVGIAVLGAALYTYAVFPTPSSISIDRAPSLLESILDEHRKAIGPDFVAYHNHCLRVYNLAVVASQRRAPLAGASLTRRDEVLQIATAFHDIGLWTDGKDWIRWGPDDCSCSMEFDTADTVAYLAPSEHRARTWLESHDRAADVSVWEVAREGCLAGLYWDYPSFGGALRRAG